MSGPGPFQQVEMERRARWARRDMSSHPLTEGEKAERRHHQANGWWARLLWLGPIALSVVIGIAFGQLQTPVLVATAIGGAFIIALVLWMMANAVLPYMSADTIFWINVAGMSLSAGGLLTVLAYLLSGGETQLGEVSGALICIAALPLWPFLWGRLRRRFTSDYERRLTTAEAPPQGIIE